MKETSKKEYCPMCDRKVSVWGANGVETIFCLKCNSIYTREDGQDWRFLAFGTRLRVLVLALRAKSIYEEGKVDA